MTIKMQAKSRHPTSASLTLADLGPLLASVVGLAYCCSWYCEQ